tara:strand:+ start:122634 stop:123557 length:924 start_codon:yes stop_codon:yes gene_type:complete
LTSPVSRLAIIGIGLIGSSIARAAKDHSACETICLYDGSADVRARAGEIGLGEIADTVTACVKDADLIILCTPVGVMGEIAEAMAPALKSGAIVSDVGSVKSAVQEAVAPHIPEGVHFIAGHPIAGTEKSGPDAGFASLFEGRWCIITPPDEHEDEASVQTLTKFWEALGSTVEVMSVSRHDRVLAITSHLPHLIAFNIVGTAHDLESVTEGEVVKFSAGGFRDFTRIAASDPVMWRDVFLNNKEAVLEMLGRFNEDLSALQRAIRWGDGEQLRSFFDRSRGIRKSIIDAGQDTADDDFGRGKPSSK